MEHYTVLQQVVEDLTGRSFDAAIRPYLFAPLEMTHSLFCPAPPKTMQDRFAIGHTDTGTPLPGGWRVYPEVAASGLWVTPQDAANAFAALFRCLRGKGTYLKAGTAQELIRPLARDKSDDDVQAMGFGITDRNGQRVLYRGGNPEGYYCQLYANAEKGSACIVLTNRNLCWQLTNEIIASVPWQ
jgi:CubicO group peptidase (beta-lactamase class C family)